jgi:hypothetical protein
MYTPWLSDSWLLKIIAGSRFQIPSRPNPKKNYVP